MAATGRNPAPFTGKSVERSVVVSPLLNLAPAPPTGARLNHSQALLPLGDSRISGTAMLSLSPDRRTLDMKIRLDRAGAATVRLCRLDPRPMADRAPAEGDLLVIEIVACGSRKHGVCIDRRFSLDRRDAFGMFAQTEQLLGTGICLSWLQAASVAGIRLEPAPASRVGNRDPTKYLTERMLMELAAAERSATAVAASRHVHLATLYARRLRYGPSAAT